MNIVAMKTGALKTFAPALLAVGLLAGAAAVGQQSQEGRAAVGQQPRGAAAVGSQPRPAPRWPDGRISFTGTATDVGNWEGPANATIFSYIENGKPLVPAASLPTNLTVDQVPFLPGVRDLFMSRESQAEDPHTRCKPSGGSRFWHTPYGIEILDMPETNEVIFLGVGAPHSWRIVYTDRREHPKNLKPTWYGDSIGRWEGDTLVVETVGFNERFWLTREGVPHTNKLRLTERLSRPNFNQLRYEATVDDPGAYSAPWTGGWHLRWSAGNEPFDYLCQENNRDPERMIGSQ